jgi:hypothetical protein
VRKAGFSDVETAKILDYNARELMPRLAAMHDPFSSNKRGHTSPCKGESLPRT